MAITTENVIINGTTYKHTWSSTGYMIKRNDGKDFVEAYDPTSSTYTYTETTTLAKQSLAARLAALETSHNTLTTRHNSLEALPHIVETGTSKDGLSWYKLYSDKCCIQGGYKTVSGTSQVVTLLRPYKDTNYIITYANRYDTVPSGTHLCNFGSKTTTQFTRYGSSAWTGFWWYCVGYIN